MKKDELVEKLKLVLDIGWERLPKADLEKAYEFFNDGEKLIAFVLEASGFENFIKTINNVALKKIVDERPLRRLLRSWLFGEEDEV